MWLPGHAACRLKGTFTTLVDGVSARGSGHSKRWLEIYNLGIWGHLPERAGAVSWELHPDSSGCWPWASLLRNCELGRDGGGVGEDQSYHRGECICFLCLVGWLFYNNQHYIFTFYINAVGYFFQSCSFLVFFSWATALDMVWISGHFSFYLAAASCKVKSS